MSKTIYPCTFNSLCKEVYVHNCILTSFYAVAKCLAVIGGSLIVSIIVECLLYNIKHIEATEVVI